MNSLETPLPVLPKDLLDGRRGSPGPGVRVRTLLHRRSLDALLMRGVARHQSAELALRACQLTTARRRRRLADSFDEVMRVADGRGRRLTAVAPLAREVRAARPALRELEIALRANKEVEPAGVLLARRLLTNGIGPLYFECGNDALWRAAKEATAALQGRVAVPGGG
jgi:hypothetical protein